MESEDSTPFLDYWRTDTLGSFIGVAAAIGFSYGLIWWEANTNPTLIEPALIASVATSAWFIYSWYYAGSLYPSLFTPYPKDGSATLGSISFQNLFFGGIIFGLIWNSNLTKGQKGFSHILYLLITVPVGAIFLLETAGLALLYMQS